MRAGADDYLVKPLDPDDLQGASDSGGEGHGAAPAARRPANRARRPEQRAHGDRPPRPAHEAPQPPSARRRPRAAGCPRRALRVALLNGASRRRPLQVLQRHLRAIRRVTRSSWRSPAAEIETEARSGDVLYRDGGEAFLCIFPEQSLASGTLAVERMQRRLAGLQLSHSTSPNGVLTLSARPGRTRGPPRWAGERGTQRSRRSPLSGKAARPQPHRAGVGAAGLSVRRPAAISSARRGLTDHRFKGDDRAGGTAAWRSRLRPFELPRQPPAETTCTPFWR
jgi:hypothetical protein